MTKADKKKKCSQYSVLSLTPSHCNNIPNATRCDQSPAVRGRGRSTAPIVINWEPAKIGAISRGPTSLHFEFYFRSAGLPCIPVAGMDSHLLPPISSAQTFTDSAGKDALTPFIVSDNGHTFSGIPHSSGSVASPANLQNTPMDILNSFMSMQGVEGQDQQQQSPEAQQAQGQHGQGHGHQFTPQAPQALLEQQLKLTRLQQLQQLQNQIFQQQVWL
jgi:hypothetical protein